MQYRGPSSIYLYVVQISLVSDVSLVSAHVLFIIDVNVSVCVGCVVLIDFSRLYSDRSKRTACMPTSISHRPPRGLQNHLKQ